MRHAVADLLRRFLQGSQLEPEEVLWGLLIVAFLLSSLHLVTMFVTRWGDRRVTGKALAFSLMVHFAIAVGVVAIPAAPGIPGGGIGDDQERHEDEHRIAIHSVAVDADREARGGKVDGGQTPVWDRLPAAKAAKLVEPRVPSPAASSLPNAPRVADRPKPAPFKGPDLALLPENQIAAPVVTRDVAATIQRSPRTPDIESPPDAPVVRDNRRSPALPHRSTPSKATSDANIGRQVFQNGNGKRTAESGPSTLTPSGAPLLPAPQSPQVTDVESKTGEPLRSKPASPPTTTIAESPSPTPSKSSTASSGTPGSPGVPAALGRDRAGATLPEGRWVASVDRLRSNNLAPGPAQPQTGHPEEYQPFDTRPAAPQVAGTSNGPLIERRSAGVPPTYRLRKLSNRKANARQFGGTDQSERAVEASLQWLAEVQTREGYWDAKAFGAGQVKIDESGVDRDYAGRDANSGVTALSILAFLGAGYTHEEGKYAETVDRALRWLVGQQRPNGNLGYGAGHFAMMYCHGMATYAIAEAYGMQNDPTSNTMLREPLARAVKFILDNQNPDGGWRYVKGQKSDMSMFGWQLMALKSAEIAGVKVPREAKTRMVAFLRERSLGDNSGLAGYREDQTATPSMTAEAMFCKQMLGMKRNNAASQEAAEYLLAHMPRRSQLNEYYWYYGTLAMYQYGGAEWQSWNGAVRDIFVSEQRTDGEFPGSWDPNGPWAKSGGRIYATALSTLCLEVYYRFLPLYQIGSAIKD